MGAGGLGAGIWGKKIGEKGCNELVLGRLHEDICEGKKMTIPDVSYLNCQIYTPLIHGYFIY